MSKILGGINNKPKNQNYTSSTGNQKGYNPRSIKDFMNSQNSQNSQNAQGKAGKDDDSTFENENTVVLKEILNKITTLTSDVSDVKSQLHDLNTTIRSVVNDEISKREEF